MVAVKSSSLIGRDQQTIFLASIFSDQEDLPGRQAPHDIMISHDTGNKEGGFFKKARKAFPMFPFTEMRMKWDDYGELISGQNLS